MGIVYMIDKKELIESCIVFCIIIMNLDDIFIFLGMINAARFHAGIAKINVLHVFKP